MEQKDFKRFTFAMAGLEENFDSECSNAKVKLYFTTLSDISIEQVESAIQKILRESVYSKFPTIGAIRQAALGSTDDRAVLAWRKVFKAIQCVGQYRSVKFDEPVIHSVIELMGGWENLCLMEQKEIQWKEKEFVNLYKSLQGKNIRHPECMLGISELQNIQKGYPEAIEEATYWPPIRELEGPENRQKKELAEEVPV